MAGRRTSDLYVGSAASGLSPPGAKGDILSVTSLAIWAEEKRNGILTF